MTKYTVVFPDKTEREIKDDMVPRVGEEFWIYVSGPHIVERVMHQYDPAGDLADRRVYVSAKKVE